MCRLLLQLNSSKNKKILSIIRKHATELEKALGGDGNGIFLPQKNKIYKSFDIRKIIARISGDPFLFHTRLATGNNVSTANCHPFIYKDTILAHNGACTDFISPANNADTKNLLKMYIDKKLKLEEMKWWGNIIIFDKITEMIFIYIKKYLVEITFKDKTKILTSQETKSIKMNRNQIKKTKILGPGIYSTEFSDDTFEKISSLNTQRYITKYKRKKQYIEVFDFNAEYPQDEIFDFDLEYPYEY